MPATFEGFGVRFLYPENWTQLPRQEDESETGVTLEMPGGGFVSLEMVPLTRTDDIVIEEISQSLRENYDDVEQEPIDLPLLADDDRAWDFRFYYLDLMVVSRAVLMEPPMATRQDTPLAGRLLFQAQAESREFDANEPVMMAIIKQVVDCIASEESEP